MATLAFPSDDVKARKLEYEPSFWELARRANQPPPRIEKFPWSEYVNSLSFKSEMANASANMLGATAQAHRQQNIEMLAQQQSIASGLPLTHVRAMMQPHAPLPIDAAENETRQRLERHGRENETAMTAMLRRAHAQRERGEAARAAAAGARGTRLTIEELERLGGVEALPPVESDGGGFTDVDEGDAASFAPVAPGQGSSSSTALRGDRPGSQSLLDAAAGAVDHDPGAMLLAVHRHQPRQNLASELRDFATQEIIPTVSQYASTAATLGRAASPSKKRVRDVMEGGRALWGSVGRASGELFAKGLGAGHGMLPSAEQVMGGVAASHAALAPVRGAISGAQSSLVGRLTTSPGQTPGAEAVDENDNTWHNYPADEPQRIVSRLWHSDRSVRRFLMDQFASRSDDPLAFVPTSEDTLRLFKVVFEAAYEGDREDGGIPRSVIRNFLDAAHNASGALGERIRRMQSSMDRDIRGTASTAVALRR